MELILIRGLPGSGKSTLAKKLSSSLGYQWFEADTYFYKEGDYKFIPADVPKAHELCRQLTQHALSNGCSVIVSNTFSRLWEMEPYLAIARHLGINITVMECQGNYGSVHGVPEETIQKMKERWEKYP